jgi:hypothetical protein
MVNIFFSTLRELTKLKNAEILLNMFALLTRKVFGIEKWLRLHTLVRKELPPLLKCQGENSRLVVSVFVVIILCSVGEMLDLIPIYSSSFDLLKISS